MDNVTYKKGHEFEGELGRIVTVDTAKNTADIKLGSSTRVGVPVSDLLLTDASTS